MNNKRRIEVFTAGCAVCNDTVKLVRESVSQCGCEVLERRCPENECCAEGKQYGVKVLPSVAVAGQIVFEGRITRAQAALLGK